MWELVGQEWKRRESKEERRERISEKKNSR